MPVRHCGWFGCLNDSKIYRAHGRHFAVSFLFTTSYFAFQEFFFLYPHERLCAFFSVTINSIWTFRANGIGNFSNLLIPRSDSPYTKVSQHSFKANYVFLVKKYLRVHYGWQTPYQIKTPMHCFSFVPLFGNSVLQLRE